MSRGPTHDIENGFDERRGHRFVKEIRHGVDEHNPWSSPSQRLLEQRLVQRYCESSHVLADSHRTKPRSHPLRVAVLAALADLGTTRYGVPSYLCPFDLRPSRHALSVLNYIGAPQWASRKHACSRTHVSEQPDALPADSEHTARPLRQDGRNEPKCRYRCTPANRATMRI